MTFELKLEPESPRLPLFGRVGAYLCLTSEFSWKRLLMQSDGPVVRFPVDTRSEIPVERYSSFYEHMFEQGLVHRTIDRFVNILFLGVKILFEAAKEWQVRFPTGKIEPFYLQNQGASSFRLRSIYRFLLF